MTLDQLLLKIQKKKATIERRKVPVGLIKDALTAYLEPFHGTMGRTIVDIDIPSFTTEEVDIKIYWR